MTSVRTRITVTAAVVTAIALALAAIFLLRGLRSSLIEQLDDTIADQVIDLQVNISDTDSLYAASALNDLGTLQVILDDVDVRLSNDLGVQASEIQQEVPLAASLSLADPLIVNASIASATDTPGAADIRLAITPLYLDDEPVDAPVTYAIVGRVLGPVQETVAAMRARLLIALPPLVGLVAVLAWWLTGRALRPVDLMRREVDEISAGDLRRRVSEPESADEIGDLAVTMNSMLGRLHDSSVRQQQFVSDAAHELRTPLTSIAAQLDVDAAHPVDADLVATAGSVRSEVSRMQLLIDSLLTLARSDQGSQALPMRLVDLDEVCRSSANRVARPDHLTLVTSGLQPVEARGDAPSLERIVDNLLANAYRHAATHVAITTGSGESGVWLAVDDDGSGVPADQHQAIFDRFVRLDEARTRDRGGSGLGLALSRELAQSHGGSLSVADNPAGGARFLLHIPDLPHLPRPSSDGIVGDSTPASS